MEMALRQAEMAAAIGEVPVGAVIVHADRLVIATGFNLREKSGDPTAHAEIVAIRRAARWMGGWRLTDCAMYVTLEPCAMCAGAIINARIDRVIYAAPDLRAGCCGTLYDLTGERKFNHHPAVCGGVLQQRSAQLLRSFFAGRR